MEAFNKLPKDVRDDYCKRVFDTGMWKKWKEMNQDAPLKLDDAQQRLHIGDRSKQK